MDKNKLSAFERFVMILALYLPCRYLWPLKANYNVDWYTHQWAIGYFGEYFRRHGVMPSVFNTTQWGGMATPIFYGNLDYPLLGFFSSLLAAGMVTRLAVVFLFVAQYVLICRVTMRLQAPRWLGHSIACLVIWATYTLTNLYNRSALTEFIATSLLVCAVSLAILLIHAADKRNERRYASRMMLCLAISAGTHPVTAMYGMFFFGMVCLCMWWHLKESPERRRSVLHSLVPGSLAAIACTASWLYASAKFQEHLRIRNIVPSVLFLPDAKWLTRFYPIPYDPRVVPGISIYDLLTPYLDVQANVPLLLFFVSLSIAALSVSLKLDDAGKLMAKLSVPVALFAFFTWISLSPDSYHFLPAIAAVIQFSYRAVTYQNLALLLGVFLLLMTLQKTTASNPAVILNHSSFRIVVTACLLLSAVGVTVKWPHIRALRTSRGDDNSALLLPGEAERKARIDITPLYQGISDYTTPDLFASMTTEEARHAIPVSFRFDSTERFGSAEPAEVVLAAPAWVRTNIQAFPWNKLEIDGESVPSSDLRVYDSTAIALHVPAGNHRLTVKFVPDRAWQILRILSLMTLFAWLVIEGALSRRERAARFSGPGEG